MLLMKNQNYMATAQAGAVLRQILPLADRRYAAAGLGKHGFDAADTARLA